MASTAAFAEVAAMAGDPARAAMLHAPMDSDALTAAGYAELSAESGVITARGLAFLERVGIDVSAMRERSGVKSGRLLCRPCLDWSERRTHLAGVVGAALCAHSFAQGFVRR